MSGQWENSGENSVEKTGLSNNRHGVAGRLIHFQMRNTIGDPELSGLIRCQKVDRSLSETIAGQMRRVAEHLRRKTLQRTGCRRISSVPRQERERLSCLLRNANGKNVACGTQVLDVPICPMFDQAGTRPQVPFCGGVGDGNRLITLHRPAGQKAHEAVRPCAKLHLSIAHFEWYIENGRRIQPTRRRVGTNLGLMHTIILSSIIVSRTDYRCRRATLERCRGTGASEL